MAKDGITLRELAAMAGVSPSTASLVLNGRPCRVSEATRRRIKETARSYAYYPHGVARSLVTSKSHTLGFLIPDICNPFFTGIARGIEDRALDFGYSVIFCSTDDSQSQEDRLLSMLRSRSVDGLIIALTADREGNLPHFNPYHIPTILIDRDYDIPGITGRVLVDNYSGAKRAVGHLLERGYRRIAFLGGPPQARSARDRFKGYQDALLEAGLDWQVFPYRSGAYSLESGARMIEDMREEWPQMDALFCANDMIAVGAMKVLQTSGRRIPEDIALVGFDDSLVAAMVTPALTTMQQPIYQIGREAVDLLIRQLEAEDGEPPLRDRVILPTQLIVRDSA